MPGKSSLWIPRFLLNQRWFWIPFLLSCSTCVAYSSRLDDHALFSSQKVIFDDAISTADKCDKCPQLCTPEGSECACFRGFIKVSEYHCQDIDECNLDKDVCGAHGKCINTVGSFICRCKSGFKPLPSGRCSDINECALAVESRPCDQVCNNLPGSFSCTCHEGYVLLPRPGRGQCVDVNECMVEEDGCSHLCVNTPGSFVCRCPSPLSLAEDERTCGSGAAKRLRKSPALLSAAPSRLQLREDVHQCPFRCLNKGVCRNGHCHCPTGLTGNVCQTDVDECSVLPWDTRCSHFCINTFGSFRCSCQSGYTLAADQKTCEPVACFPPCMGGGVCVSGKCSCPLGLTGPACVQDIDECEVNPCQHICRNTLGSFACLCRGKWRLRSDGRSCEEPSCIPHCRNGGRCQQGHCVCTPGFHGRLCQLDTNECAQAESPCPYACVNTQGSFQCLCPAGMQQSANRTACVMDPLGDQHSADNDMRVMIEVVVRDQHHFTRYFVNPVMATPSLSAHTLRTEFPYQPLFQQPREVLHIRNSIERRPVGVERFSSSPSFSVRVKTEQVNIVPSQVRTVVVPTASVLDAHFVVHHEERTSSSAAETPALPTEKILIQSSPSTENLVPFVDIETTTVPNLDDDVEDVGQIETDAPTTFKPEVETNFSSSEIPEEISTLPVETKTEPLPIEMAAEINATNESTLTISEENNSPTTTTESIQTENEKVDVTSVISSTSEETELTTEEAQEFTSSPLPSSVDTTSEFPIPEETTTAQTIVEKVKKIRKKKQKKKKKKKNSGGDKLKMLNQILQTFGLENHQGDAKQFDLIDFDEINQKQAAVTTSKPYHALDLPVYKKAMVNASEERDCYYLRNKIKSRSHFYRDEKNCTKCSCKNGELRCDAHHCPTVRCDDPIEGTCCDYCPGDCVIDNQVYQLGEHFVPELDPCRECKCEDGREICTDVECPALGCASKWRAQLPDDCCPSCVPPGPGCFWNQQFFYVGQLWVQRQGGCQACLCREGGAVECNPVPCVLDCLHPQFVAGECCPVCDNCQYQDKKYANGESFRNPSDPCSTCKCHSGNISCFDEGCDHNCSHPFKPPGKCCPECTDCLFENRHIREGDTRVFGRENGTCTECSCKAGDIHCWASECSSSCTLSNGTVVSSGTKFTKPDDICTTCRCVEGDISECRNQPCSIECEYGVLLPGACCVQCLMCDYQGTVYRNLQAFKSPVDPCLNCMCVLGNVMCEENTTCIEESDESYEDESDEEEEME